ncbi:MAG: aminotransferase class V-fold PLP-dependent enzyme [Patescibacteria group bacterium]
MKHTYFTVGPSQTYPTIPDHVKTAMDEEIVSLSHRSEQFKQLFKQTDESLKQLLNIPQDYSIFFFSSATECWERILENCVFENSFHVISGAFSTKFYEAALGMKKNAEKYQFDGLEFNLETVSTDTELIAFTQNETSNGMMIPMEYIYKVRESNPDKLIALDVVSSIPYVTIDFSKIDLTFFSLQKGFGLPAGLAVMIVSPAALEKAQEVEVSDNDLTTYRRFSSMKKYYDKQQTFETPNVFGIYLLNKVTQDMLQKGVEVIRQEIDQKADLLYTFFKDTDNYSLANEHEEFRSKTVVVANVPAGSTELLKRLQYEGFILGAGYEALKDQQIRIANFPTQSVDDVKRLISVL